MWHWIMYTVTCRFVCEDPEAAPDGPLSVLNPVKKKINNSESMVCSMLQRSCFVP